MADEEDNGGDEEVEEQEEEEEEEAVAAVAAAGFGELQGLGLEQQEWGEAEWTTARHD